MAYRKQGLQRGLCGVAAMLLLAFTTACSVLGSSLDEFTEGGDAGTSAGCDTGQVECDGQCVDTTSSPDHCGSCGNSCAVGQACQGGSCTADCQTGQTQCGDLCVDTQSNAQHCGGCDKSCNSGESCVSGQCQITCPGGQVACSGLCYDLQNDVNNCGSCGNKCSTGEVCGNGQCALTCPAGQTACGGTCADLQTDSQHCGACGTACGANEECSGGSCVIACKTLLNQQITDPWGEAWDGLERAAADYTTAETTCQGIGGRLPTATELYRVSATQSATVGQTINTNWLWSMVPVNATSRARVRLSDANVANQSTSSALNYRCVCPPPLPKAFVGNNCYGPPGQACFGLDSEGKRYNVDTADRAPLPVASAIWECTFNRGHLPTFVTLMEAVQQGLDGGSTNSWLHTADGVRYDLNAIIRWQGVVAAPLVIGNGGYTTNTNNRAFRCAGLNYEAGTHPASITDEFVGALSTYKGEAVDSTATQTWTEAHDTCWGRGGHVPRDDELTELIQQGLPAGSGSWVWTSDQAGYNGTDFLTKLVRWTGTAPEFSLSYSGESSAGYKTTSRLTRCIYYPVDTGYAGPQAADCAGGCTELAMPGSSGAKMWLDSFDRAPSATFEDALDDCRKAGGHLASERDLTEAIRASLPNGTNNHLWTSDMSKGSNTTNSNLYIQIVRWQGTDPAFTDLYNTYSTWSQSTTTRPYRCMWTNELR